MDARIPVTRTDDGKVEFDIDDLFALLRADQMKKWPPHRRRPTIKRSSASSKRIEKRLRQKITTAGWNVQIVANSHRYARLQRNVELALRDYGVSWRKVEKEAHKTGMEILQAGRHLLRIYSSG